jgi:hypothetical protein
MSQKITTPAQPPSTRIDAADCFKGGFLASGRVQGDAAAMERAF